MIARRSTTSRERKRRHPAPKVLGLLASLWVIAGILYTPVHLLLEVHSEGSEAVHGVAAQDTAIFATHGDHHHDGHHACHSAAQHPSQLGISTRIEVVKVVEVLALAAMTFQVECPRPQRLRFSGLSPPPHARCWQFLVRAALPARAPTLLS